MIGEAILGGGASLLGGLMSNMFTDKRQQEAMAFNAAQAQAQMDFQERMSSTAYQRTMADMKKAGLNPILAYQKGPTSSPTGAAASTSYTPATDVLTPAANTALAATRNRAEVDNMLATNELIRQQSQNAKMEEIRIGSQVSNINANTSLLREALEAAMKEAGKARTASQFYEHPVGKVLQSIGLGLREVNPFGSGGGSPSFGELWKLRGP